MGNSGMGLFRLGKTASAIPSGSLGLTKEFDDTDLSAGNPGVKPKLSNMKITARLVQNKSGGALLPGSTCVFDTANWGLDVSAAGAAAARVHGVVDPYLPAAGVADDDYFWLITHGPAKVRKTAAAINAGDNLLAAAAGEAAQGAFGVSNVGEAMETSAAAQGTLVRAYVNPIVTG